MINEDTFTDDTGQEHRVTGPPIYELGSFINILSWLAMEADRSYIDYDDVDRDHLTLTKVQLAYLCADAIDQIGSADCNWCAVDTSEIGEFPYMVHDEIWDRYGPKKDRSCLCVGCLEERMGRQLRPEDFTDAQANTNPYQHRSDRLLDRLGMTPLLLPLNPAERRRRQTRGKNGQR